MSDSLFLPKFAQDPQTSVEEAQKAFESGPLKSRIDELESDPSYCPHKICNTSWAGRTIAVCCETCQVIKKGPPSYLCVPCFLNGNHTGHKYYITYVTTASCSCGNPHKIDPSGFCSRHHIPSNNPHIDDFGIELSQIPILIFSEAIESLTFLSAFDSEGLKVVIDFLLSIATKSDSLMRCLEIAICEKNDLALFLINSAAFSLNSMKILSQFFYNFFNDDYFSLNFGLAIMKSIIPFTKIMINYDIKMAFGNIMPPHHHVFEFMFSNYAFNRPLMTSFLLSKGCDISNIIINCITLFQQAINANWNYARVKMMFFHQFLSFFSEIILRLPDDTSLNLWHSLLPIFARWEYSHKFKRAFGDKLDDPNKEQELAFELGTSILSIFDGFKTTVIHDLPNFAKFFFNLNQDMLDENLESTLEKAAISNLQTFSILFESLIVHNDDSQGQFIDLLKKIDVPLDLFIKCTMVMPLRWFSFASQSFFGLFVRNDDSSLTSAQKFYYKNSITAKLFPMFSLIQFYSGLFSDKNEFTLMIDYIFGLFTFLEDKQKEADKLFSVIFFIACIVFDRVVMTNDVEEFRRLLIISILQEKPLTVINLNKLLWEQITTVPTYIAELGNITTRVKGEEYSLLKLKPNVKWHVIQPWKPPSEVMKMIGNFIQKHEDQLAPFPDWSDEPNGIELRGILLTRNMFALEYRALSDIVSDPSMNKATVHLVLNIILQTHRIFTSDDFDKYSEIAKKFDQLSDEEESKTETQEESKTETQEENKTETQEENKTETQEENKTETQEESKNIDTNNSDDDAIVAKTTAELAFVVPAHFEEFINAQISFLHRPKASLIDLLKKIGPLANPVLEELGITPVVSQKSDQMKEERRGRAKQLKLSIMAEFRDQQNMFNGSKADLAENEECSVCRVAINDSILCYPAIVHLTGIPWFIQSGQFKQTLFVNICTHLVHSSCAKNEMSDRMYRCPIDRSMYNFFIARLATGFNVESSQAFFKAMEIINENFHTLKSTVHPATIIAGHLIIAEVRYRNWPDSLDKPVFAVFMSNFFVNAWHYIRMLKEAGKETKNAEKIDKFSQIEKLVLDFLEAPAPFVEAEVAETIKKFAVDLHGDELLIYLRQAAILQHFCLAVDLSPSEQFVDWESFLSFKSLCKRYNIQEAPQNSHKDKINTNENANTSENTNENANTNENTNKNSNENANTSEITNENSNTNENTNENANTNENTNKNSNENANTSEITNENANTSENTNENSNTNENTNENSNENSNTNENTNENSNTNENTNLNTNVNSNLNDNENNNDNMNVNVNSIELPLFSIVHLPNNFLEFALPPYSLNLAETSSLTALCLLTNTVISISKASTSSQYPSLGSHLQKLGGTSLLLLLNGPFSTAIAVASNEFSFVVKIISPYINDYGDEDPGFVTGRVLTLSHERLERAYDLYLSGEWTKFIPK